MCSGFQNNQTKEWNGYAKPQIKARVSAVIVLTASDLLGDDVTGERLNIGVDHSVTGTRASVAGGVYNTNAALNAFIGGGAYNVLHSNANISVIAGGDADVIYSPYSTIGGGYMNRILWTNGLPVDPGFDWNDADYSVIAGEMETSCTPNCRSFRETTGT